MSVLRLRRGRPRIRANRARSQELPMTAGPELRRCRVGVGASTRGILYIVGCDYSRESLIQRVRQFLDGEFSARDLHDRNTGDLAESAAEVFIICSDDVDSVFRYLSVLAVSLVPVLVLV